MKKNSSLLILLLGFCTACVGIVSPTATIPPTLMATLTPTPNQTPTLTVTPTPTATPAPTLTPTQDPIALAIIQFDLNPERTYTIVEDYLVDSFNQAKMAKWENGAWVDATLEEKYGHLAPENPNFFYTGWHVSGVPGDYWSRDSRNKPALIVPVYTGNSKEVNWWYEQESREISLEVLQFVFRDNEKVLYEIHVAVGSKDVDKSLFYMEGVNTGGALFRTTDVSKLSGVLNPGERAEIHFNQVAVVPPEKKCFEERDLEFCTDNAIMLFHLWQTNGERISQFAEAAQLGKEINSVADIIIPAQVVVTRSDWN